jgi:uncharacterized protein YbbC (DUF1343 family)
MKRLFFEFTILISTALFSMSIFAQKEPIPGANQIELYKSIIEGKSVAVVANQTSMIGSTHLVDTLLSIGINIKVIFAPEHGFRNLADAGESIENGKDTETGIPIISLYGSHLKPTPLDLKGIDVVIFDIQDVGTVSILIFQLSITFWNHVLRITLNVLFLTDPILTDFILTGIFLDTAYKSFVAMDPVPVVHGMTVGEYSNMLNGEGWLKNGVKCDLVVINCKNYTHKTLYELPVRPSPNLPNQTSVYLYPSICFFEGTGISGKGNIIPVSGFRKSGAARQRIQFYTRKSSRSKKPASPRSKMFWNGSEGCYKAESCTEA